MNNQSWEKIITSIRCSHRANLGSPTGVDIPGQSSTFAAMLGVYVRLKSKPSVVLLMPTCVTPNADGLGTKNMLRLLSGRSLNSVCEIVCIDLFHYLSYFL